MRNEKIFIPRLIFWETTRFCNLPCPHCRASSVDRRLPDELNTEEGFALIDNITSFSNPILVLSGGEPLVRPDIYELSIYGTRKGLRVVLATNGTLITLDVAEKLKEAGIKRISVSLYGSGPDIHDKFCGLTGAFDETMKGIRNILNSGIPLQINTTVTKRNLHDLPSISEFAVSIGADAHHIFLLVPTGRGKEIEGDEIAPEEYEKVLNWFYDRTKEVKINLKATCAPHYFRIMKQRSASEGKKITSTSDPMGAMTRGCLAGSGVCFISYKGEVFPCGYLPVLGGNIREKSFREIWDNSEIFQILRDETKLKGKCGICEYKWICLGCRARAYARTGDYMDEEPYCIYIPRRNVIARE